MKNWCETELAYIAGLIDGEGCITFSDNGTGCIRPKIQLIMTDKEVVGWLGDLWDTPVAEFAKHRAEPHHKKQFRITITGERAVDVATKLKPFMRVKHRQAQLLIDWLDTKFDMDKERRTEKRKALKEESHRLNDDRRPAHMDLRK